MPEQQPNTPPEQAPAFNFEALSLQQIDELADVLGRTQSLKEIEHGYDPEVEDTNSRFTADLVRFASANPDDALPIFRHLTDSEHRESRVTAAMHVSELLVAHVGQHGQLDQGLVDLWADAVISTDLDDHRDQADIVARQLPPASVSWLIEELADRLRWTRRRQVLNTD